MHVSSIGEGFFVVIGVSESVYFDPLNLFEFGEAGIVRCDNVHLDIVLAKFPGQKMLKHTGKITDAADIVMGYKENFKRSGCALTVDFKIGFHDCLLQYSESRDSPHYSRLNICRQSVFRNQKKRSRQADSTGENFHST